MYVRQTQLHLMPAARPGIKLGFATVPLDHGLDRRGWQPAWSPANSQADRSDCPASRRTVGTGGNPKESPMTIELHDVRSELLVAELFCDVQLTDDRRSAERGEHATVMADAVIAQVIQLKDPAEPIAGAVWWRVAELLRACTTATAAGSHLTAILIEHALAEVDDVLNALTIEVDGDGSAQQISGWLLLGGRHDALTETKDSCLRLARLMFSLDPTTPAVLATRVNQLRRALAAWHAQVLFG
jgi:hypothetical protein